MPWSSASRGEPKVTGLPSTFTVPSEWGWSPAMILMRVDLPAPLSPSTQVTSPALTVRLMPDRATMGPKDLPTSVISISGWPRCRAGSACSARVSVMVCLRSTCRRSAPGGGVVLDVEVDQHREQQHRAEEGVEPVRVEPGEHDALGGHAEDERADRSADHAAVAAGQEAAADDRGDDVDELVADAQAGLHRGEVEQQVHAVEPGQERHAHEQANFDLGDGDADGAGGVLVAADGEDPVADLGAEQDPGADRDEQQPPQHGDLDGHEPQRDVGGEERLGRVEPVEL